MKNLLLAITLIAVTFLAVSCATTSPNQKLIIGTWIPVKVEKYLTPEEQEQLNKMKAEQQASAATPQAKKDTASLAKEARKGGGGGTPEQKMEAQLNRLIQSELRATLTVGADNIAVKDYPGNPVKGSWKMKRNGTRIIAKSFKTKQKYALDIVSITDTNAVIIENLPVGALKISYVKKK